VLVEAPASGEVVGEHPDLAELDGGGPWHGHREPGGDFSPVTSHTRTRGRISAEGISTPAGSERPRGVDVRRDRSGAGRVPVQLATGRNGTARRPGAGGIQRTAGGDRPDRGPADRGEHRRAVGPGAPTGGRS